MPSSRPATCFLDILDNIRLIQSYLQGMDRAAFEADSGTRDAVERCLERLSEAANKLGSQADELAPGLPWAAVRAFGNVLRHAYDQVDSARIRDRTFENQSFRASGLSLITAAIVHWNTVYLDRAVQQLRSQGVVVPGDILAHVAPLGWEHIALTGDYVWSGVKPEPGFRPLHDVRATFLPLAA